MLKIVSIQSPLLDSNMYIASSGANVLVVDPFIAEETFDSLDAQNMKVDMVLLTHEHYDHISGVNWIKDRYNCPVLCSRKCAENIESPRMNYSQFFAAFCEIQQMMPTTKKCREVVKYKCSANMTFEHDIAFEWHGHRIEARETPGHSKGSSCYLIDNAFLFCGDVMFRDYPTQMRFFGGSKNEMESDTMPYLRSLNSDILVYPGHFKQFYLKEYIFGKLLINIKHI